jgi:hypothetical protein
MRRASAPIHDLRLAIDCLPLRTREAMLEGLRDGEIMVGAYSDRDGGVCPMLAAHRRGGRTSFVSFAHAWDRFAVARRARRATKRELRVLRGQLEASIAAGLHLGETIADHQALVRGRKAAEAAELGLRPPLPDAGTGPRGRCSPGSSAAGPARSR